MFLIYCWLHLFLQEYNPEIFQDKNLSHTGELNPQPSLC